MTDLTCEQLVELASAHLDGELASTIETSFEQHVRACPGCAGFVDQLAATSSALRRLGEMRA